MISKRHIAVAVACGALVAGCGGDDEGRQLPPDSVQQLDRQLGFIENALDEGSAASCRTILSGSQPNRAEVDRILAALPSDVDAEVRDATDDSFSRLFDLVEQECEAREQTEEDTQTETEPEPVPTVTETVPAETETEPPKTETAPPEEPGKGNGNDGNQGGGNGNEGNQGGGQQAPEGGN